MENKHFYCGTKRVIPSGRDSAILPTRSRISLTEPTIEEGREGVKWELGFAFFRGWEMGFCALGLGFIEKNNRKMGMGFQFEQHRLGLWYLSWDLKKTISWEIGLGPPSRPS